MSTGFSWQRANFLQGSLQGFAHLEQGISAPAAVQTRAQKGTGVDDQAAVLAMADRLVSVAIDNTVNLWKKVPESTFDIGAETGTVGKADGMVSQADGPGCRQLALHLHVAHVAMHSINGKGGKALEDLGVGKVAGMEEGLTAAETVMEKGPDPIIGSLNMGVGKNAYSKHRKFFYINVKIDA